MKSVCCNCNQVFEYDTNAIVVACPHCGTQYNTRPTAQCQATQYYQPAPKKEGIDVLCLILGVLLNVIGLIVAAIISGRRGAISALWGMLIGGLLLFSLVVMSSRAVANRMSEATELISE